MHITSIDYMKIFIPWKDSFKDPMQRWRAMGGTSPEEEDSYVVIRVHTDEGLVGLGEGGRSIPEAKEAGEKYIGANPATMDLLNLQPPFLHAFVDIAAQALGVPACLLLGGKYRDKVSVAYWSPYLPPNETALHAEEGARLGFKTHKIKARPWDAVEQVKAMAKAAGPEYRIRIDPNETFALPAATVRIDKEVEGYNVESFEDPVPKNRPEWYALLRRKCVTPIALHSSDTKLIADMARCDGIDYVNVGGPPNRARAAAAVAQAVGCPVWVQFEGHCLDIAAAFNIHMAAAIPNATLPSDILPFLREGYLCKDPIEPDEGFMRVPDGPGLGIALDEKMVERYRIA